VYKKGVNWWKCYLIMAVKIKLKACRNDAESFDQSVLHSNIDWLKTQGGHIISGISSFLSKQNLRIWELNSEIRPPLSQQDCLKKLDPFYNENLADLSRKKKFQNIFIIPIDALFSVT